MRDMIGREVVVGDYIAMVTYSNPKKLRIYSVEKIGERGASIKDYEDGNGRIFVFEKHECVWVDSNYIMIKILEK